MNFLSVASKFEAELRKTRRAYEAGGFVWNDAEQRELAERQLRHLMAESLRYEAMYREIREESGLGKSHGTYTLDIRPPPETDFDTFQSFVGHFFDRTPVTDYIYVYEQKGTAIDDMGRGFHIHAVLKSTWRSKGEILRAVDSSLDKYDIPHLDNITAKCTLLKLDKDVRNKVAYMTEGKSKDGHKETTFAFDIEWRNKIGLRQKYVKGAYQDDTAP